MKLVAHVSQALDGHGASVESFCATASEASFCAPFHSASAWRELSRSFALRVKPA
jgi:hypothetical protein